jgi:hypothetical protein
MCDERLIPTDTVNNRYRGNGVHGPAQTLNGSVAAADNGQALMARAA